MTVKFCQLLCGNPQFLVVAGTHGLNGIPGRKRLIHLESGYIAPIAGIGVPLVPFFCDLVGIALVQHRVEDGLLRQSGWKAGEIILGNQVVLGLTYRAV